MSSRNHTAPLVFDVTGMDCGDCAKSVERVVGQLPGVGSAMVSFGGGTLTIERDGASARSDSMDEFERAVGNAVQRAGYSANLRTAGRLRQAAPPWWQNRKLIPNVLATVLWIAGVIAGQFTSPILLYAAAIVVGGWPIARAAVASIGARRLDMNVLMSISVVGAMALGDWSEGGLVVVLFSLGTALQGITFDRTRRAIRSMLELAPEEAMLLRNGVEMVVAADTLVAGDLMRVRPGDRIAADGRIIEGQSAIVQAAITGESMPVERRAGEDVFAGTINGSGALLIEVTHPSSESMLATIVHMVEDAQGSRAPSQQVVDRFARIYTPAVVVAAIGICLVGWVVTGEIDTWLYRALVLLVIACPCALVISTPVTIVSAIGAATRAGILVKGGAALEAIGRVKVVAMDKTGTMTMGRPAVVALEPADATIDEREMLSLAAAVERGSTHPLGHAIMARALHDNVDIPVPEEFEEHPGRGAGAQIGGREIVVGSDRWMEALGAPESDLALVSRRANIRAESGTTVLSVGERTGDTLRLLGTIAIADGVRPGAREGIEAIRREGVERIVMLTGDRREVATAIATEVGVDEARGDLLPDDKARAIEELRKYGPVAMVGDGVNDAPSLAMADVGIAMGIGGTDIALQSADLALMRDDLRAMPTLLRLAHRTHTIINQNIALSLLTKVAALTLGTLGFVNLWIAVLVDVGTSLVVTLNGLRLARANDRAATAPDDRS